ncbi:hypothetical protein PAXRUDRAFT_648061 [Paxillus rubicundulus Ve08.2h10]|uniref:Uncharacterized protein n=1 Tax=Paxillus rubicundulus Ve08.2h10 TaxID=930991 RepID=A0A0D0DJ70_9AGAM|nr:hypothetical protein PAXRUDRAFT_648061 [Paxillus rubicundulus Ve08.2h10]
MLTGTQCCYQDSYLISLETLTEVGCGSAAAGRTATCLSIRLKEPLSNINSTQLH